MADETDLKRDAGTLTCRDGLHVRRPIDAETCMCGAKRYGGSREAAVEYIRRFIEAVRDESAVRTLIEENRDGLRDELLRALGGSRVDATSEN